MMFQRYLILSLSLCLFAHSVIALTQESLDKAVQKMDVETVKNAPIEGFNWNKRLDYKNSQQENIQGTYLHIAVRNGDHDMVDALLKKVPGLVNSGDSYQVKPLRYAIDYLKAAPQSDAFKKIVSTLFMPSVATNFIFEDGDENIGQSFMKKDFVKARLKQVFLSLTKDKSLTNLQRVNELSADSDMYAHPSPIFDGTDFLDWASQQFVINTSFNHQIFEAFLPLIPPKARLHFINPGFRHAVINRHTIWAQRFIDLGASSLNLDQNKLCALDYAFTAQRVKNSSYRTIYQQHKIDKETIALAIAAIPENIDIDIEITHYLDKLVNYNIRDYLSKDDLSDHYMVQDYNYYRRLWGDSIAFVINNVTPNFTVEHLYVERFQEVLKELIKSNKITIKNLSPEILNEEIIAELTTRFLGNDEYQAYLRLSDLLKSNKLKIGKDTAGPFVQLAHGIELMNDNNYWPHTDYNNTFYIHFGYINLIKRLMAKFPLAIDQEHNEFDLTEQGTFVIKISN